MSLYAASVVVAAAEAVCVRICPRGIWLYTVTEAWACRTTRRRFSARLSEVGICIGME